MLYQTLRLRQNAYHEAGHVVMAHLVGINLKEVSINENDGFTDLSDAEVTRQNKALSSGEHIKEVMMPLIQVLTAGSAAEKMFSEKHRDPASAAYDCTLATQYLAAMEH